MSNGLITLRSPLTADETLRRLILAIQRRGLRRFTTIDHAAAACDAGLTMRAASLVVFGSPKAGTPLMEAAPTRSRSTCP